MTLFCPHCHLPVRSKKVGSGYCCYGCWLASIQDGIRAKDLGWRIFISGVLALIGILMTHFSMLRSFFSAEARLWYMFGLALASFLLLGTPFLRYTFSSLKIGKSLGIEIFMVLVVLMDYSFALYLSLFQIFAQQDIPIYSPFYVMGLFLLAIHLVSVVEARVRKRSYADIEKITSLRPQKAKRLVKKQKIETYVSELRQDDLVYVDTGEVIPCDGVIDKGTTSVDESMFTAEDTILHKSKGDHVTGASINRDGPIVVRLTQDPGEHSLEQMIRSIKQTLEKTLVIQGKLEKLVPLLFCGVCVVAVSTYTYYGAGDPHIAFLRVLSILIVLSFSIWIRMPSVVVALSIGKVASRGIFLRSGGLFSRLAKMATLFFSKTGVLTNAHYHYSQHYLEKGVNQGDLLSTFFSLEETSDHPIAKAITTHPWYLEIDKFPVKDFEVHSGLGISGKVKLANGKEVSAVIGNLRLLKRHRMHLSRAMRSRLEELETMGETVVLCGWDREVKGLFSFVDTLRSDVKPLLEKLDEMAIKPVMVTGDHDEMMGHLTMTKGLQHIYTRCLPTEKANKIKNAQEKGDVVGMVATVSEPTEPLIKADVSMILGAGSQLKSQDAGVIILGKKLKNIANLIFYSKKVYRTIKWGLLLGILYCLGGAFLAFPGYINPLESLVAVGLVSTILIFYPLQLIRYDLAD